MIEYDKRAWEKDPKAFMEDDPDWSLPHRAQLLRWLDAIKPTSLLDVGCCDGRLVGKLRKGGWEGVYRGLDITQSFIDEARRRHRNERFHYGDARSMSYGDWEFDTVVSSLVVCHLPDPAEAAKECFRVSSAYVILATLGCPDGEDSLVEEKDGFLNHYISKEELQGWVPDGWKAQLIWSHEVTVNGISVLISQMLCEAK